MSDRQAKWDRRYIALAQEVASRGITINCIAPGFIVSHMTDVLPDSMNNRRWAGDNY